MEEFNTTEKIKGLFEKNGLAGQSNSYFILYKDTTASSLGGLAAGIENGMEFPYDAVLVNRTENGLEFILLVVDGVVWNFVKLEKLHLKNNETISIKNEDIESVKIKKYALLNSSKKKIAIKLKSGKTYNFYANVKEPSLPYHDEGFDKFTNEWAK